MLCGAENAFHQPGRQLPEEVLALIFEDMVALESTDVTEIQPLPAKF